jgi:membrane protease YdiL (CAAX protease family)
MPDEITPHAKPIPITGAPEWFPPAEEERRVERRAEPTTLHWIFRGKDGLRAGWSLLLWGLLVALIGSVVTKGMHAALSGRIPPHTTPEWLLLCNSAVLFFVTGFAALIVSRIEGRPWRRYGIGGLGGRLFEFAVGLLSGFGVLSLLVYVLWKFGYLTFGGIQLHGARTILLWAFLFGLSFLFTGFFEEFTFRGFPQFTLTRGIAGMLRSAGMERYARPIAFWITAILLAIAFGAVHGGNPGEGRMGLYSAGTIGFLFAFSLWRTGSLWWAIGFHAAWDWAESYFYGTADSGMTLPHRLMTAVPQGDPYYSGGSIGPEGSVFVWGAIVLTGLLIALTIGPRPDWPRRVYQRGKYEEERRVARRTVETERRTR